MSIRPLLIAGLLLTAGCAHREPGPPTCDGSARRPANPHGSVLDRTATPPPAAPVLSPASSGGCA